MSCLRKHHKLVIKEERNELVEMSMRLCAAWARSGRIIKGLMSA
jgi:hypothetical protein